MHRSLTLVFICTTLFWSSIGFAALGELGDNSGSNDNPHNLSSRQTGTTPHATDMPGTEIDTQICIFCHTPHGATPKSTLWNRPDPTGPTGGFPLRAGTLTIDDAGLVGNTHYSTTATEGYPNGTSKLCLSCHDGVTAIGTLATGDSIDMTIPTLDNRASEIDLTTSHPISFIYDATVVGLLGASSYQLPPDAGYLETGSDGNTRVQCTSCHQPHQDTKGTGLGTLPFWRYDDGDPSDYGPVCVECHKSGTPGIPGNSTDHDYTP